MIRTFIDLSRGGYWTGVGSRETPLEHSSFMSKISEYFEDKGLVLRSGKARGADTFFENGAVEKEVYVPVDDLKNSAHDISLQDLHLKFHNVDEAISITKEIVRHWDRLDPYIKILHTRNVYQVLGKDLKTPSLFLICYAEIDPERSGRVRGGTNTAVQVARKANIPVFNIKYEYDRKVVQDWIGEK